MVKSCSMQLWGMFFVVPYVAASMSSNAPELRVPMRQSQPLHPISHSRNCDFPPANQKVDSEHSEYTADSKKSRSTDRQLVLRAWHQAVLQNMTDGREVVALDMVPRKDVLEFLESPDFVGFKIRFKPHCHDIESVCSQDALGTLMSTEPCSTEHQAAAGAIGQSIILEMLSIGHGYEVQLLPSPHIMIGAHIKQPDMAFLPTRGLIGNGVLDDGFGFPFPTLVVEAAFAEPREQLIEDLELWMSPRTSVQVAIGIKIHGSRECSEDGAAETISAIDAVLYRRNAPSPEPTRFHPAQPDAPAVLRVHLSDLLFGVARDRLPTDLQQRMERDEAIEVDLAFVREMILKGTGRGRLTRRS
jgi:hypothetical protein